MEKITFFDSGRKRIKKTKLWLGVLSACVGQMMFAQDSGTIQIGAGTATANGAQAMPVSNYNFNYSQQIITAAEYASGGGAAGEITKLRYKITTVGTFTVWNNWRVFIGNTTKTAFTSKTDWIPMSELEEVFNGNIVSVAPTAGDWIEITFTAPFDYTGGNIVVAIDENTPGWTTSPAWASYTSTTGAGLLYRSDDVNHDPTVSNPPDPATTTSDFTDEAYVLALVPQIQFEGTLADCVAPLGLVAGNVTAFTADVSWDASGSSSAEGYEYVLSTSNTPPTGAGTATEDGNTYVQLENLTPQTTYYLFVRTNCGSESFSEWSVPRSFTTGCVPVTTFPFVENFNADSTSKQCWTVIDGNADTFKWNLNGTTIPRSGQSAELYTDASSSNNDYLITPQLELGSAPKRLKFWVRHYSNGEPDNLNVRVSTTGRAIADFTANVFSLSTTQITTTYTEYIVDLTDYVDTTIYLAFAREDAPANGWYLAIDDVTIEDVPACPDQTGLVVASITSDGAATSWDDLSANGAIGYEYAVTPSATPPASGTATAGTFYSASGLAPNTVHYLHVRASCDEGEYGIWVTKSFKTACVAVSNFPFVETFNTDSTSKECWTVIDGNADNNLWVLNGTVIPRSGESAQLYTDTSSSNNDYLITPQLDLGAEPKRLKFWVRHRSNGEPENLNVRVSTTGRTIADFTANIFSLSTTQITTTYTEYVVDLSDYTDSTIYIAFAREDAPANGWYLAIDDVTVENIPGCPDQTGLVVESITHESASTSWDDMSANGAVAYEYAITTSATPPASGDSTTNTYYEAAGLDAETVYYLHVRTVCDDDAYGIWVTKSFKTLCAPITALPYLEPFDTVLPDECWMRGDNGNLTTGPATFGSNSWYESGFGNDGSEGSIVYNLYTTGANDWIISPQFTIPAEGYELKFSAAATDYVTTDPVSLWEDDDFVEVLVSTDGTTNWVVLDTYNSSNIPSNTGSLNVLNLDDYAGETVRFAFRAVEGTANGSADFEFFVDNFEVRLAPTCPDQTGLIVGSVTSDSASTSWDDMSGAGVTGYEYAVTTSATPPASGEATTDTYYEASGLTPQTVHYLHVRVSCDGGDFGYWSTISFTTLCAPVTALPYVENFDTFLPLCWELGENGDLTTGPTSLGYSDWVEDGFDNDSGTGAIRYNLYTTGANDWIITPQFVIPATGYELKFDAAAFQWASTSAPSPAWEEDDFVQVLVSTNGTSDWTVLYTYDSTNVPPTSGATNMISLDDYAGETVRFALRAVEGTANGATDLEFIVDNFEVRVALNSAQFDKSALKVYPNPTKNILYVNYNQEISNVEVYNLVGQRVANITPNANEGQIDMSNLASGAYFVKVTSNNATRTVKVIKE